MSACTTSRAAGEKTSKTARDITGRKAREEERAVLLLSEQEARNAVNEKASRPWSAVGRADPCDAALTAPDNAILAAPTLRGESAGGLSR